MVINDIVIRDIYLIYIYENIVKYTSSINSMKTLISLVASIETQYWTFSRLEIAGTESLIIRITDRSAACEN